MRLPRLCVQHMMGSLLPFCFSVFSLRRVPEALHQGIPGRYMIEPPCYCKLSYMAGSSNSVPSGGDVTSRHLGCQSLSQPIPM